MEKKVVGIDGYSVDIINHICYSTKWHRKKAMKVTEPYKCVTLYHDGATHAYPLARIEFCAIHGIDIRRLSRNNIVMRNQKGEVYLTERSECSKRAARTRKSNRMTLSQVKMAVTMIEDYQQGRKCEYVLFAEREAERVKRFIEYSQHRSSAVLDIAIEKALQNLYKTIDEGAVIINPYNYLKRSVYTFLKHEKKHHSNK